MGENTNNKTQLTMGKIVSLAFFIIFCMCNILLVGMVIASPEYASMPAIQTAFVISYATTMVIAIVGALTVKIKRK